MPNPPLGVSTRLPRALSSMITAISPTDRRQAWECARDDAQLAFRLWCSAPYGAKREAYTAYRAAADREDVAIAALATT
jgi:hypothetical protein